MPALSIKIRASGRKRLLRSLSLKSCRVQRNVRLKHVGAGSSEGGVPLGPARCGLAVPKGQLARGTLFLLPGWEQAAASPRSRDTCQRWMGTQDCPAGTCRPRGHALVSIPKQKSHSQHHHPALKPGWGCGSRDWALHLPLQRGLNGSGAALGRAEQGAGLPRAHTAPSHTPTPVYVLQVASLGARGPSRNFSACSFPTRGDSLAMPLSYLPPCYKSGRAAGSDGSIHLAGLEVITFH